MREVLDSTELQGYSWIIGRTTMVFQKRLILPYFHLLNYTQGHLISKLCTRTKLWRECFPILLVRVNLHSTILGEKCWHYVLINSVYSNLKCQTTMEMKRVSMPVPYVQLVNNFEKNSHALRILLEWFYLYTYPRIKTDEM